MMKKTSQLLLFVTLILLSCSDQKGSQTKPSPQDNNQPIDPYDPYTPNNQNIPGNGDGTGNPLTVLPRPEPLVLSSFGNWACTSNSSAQSVLQAQNLPSTISNINNVVNYVTLNQNHLFTPQTVTARAYAPNKRFRIATWNVHHGVDAAGNCYQLSYMVAVMNFLQADVLLLQEVNAFDAKALSDGTGMRGYFGYTYPTAGNMILVHPALAAVEQHSTLTTHTGITNLLSLGSLYTNWMTKKTIEPRNIQNLLLSNGANTFAIWNSHFPLGDCDAACQANVLATVDTQIKSQSARAQYSFGGGDMNGAADHQFITGLTARGFRGDAQGGIDWIFANGSNGPANITVQKQEIKNSTGQMLSDHPLVWTDILVQ